MADATANGFRVREVSARGHSYHLRELSAGAVEALDAGASEYAQALALVALSLSAADGTPRFTRETLDEGLAEVRALPAAVLRDALIPAARELNGDGLDDARGN